MTPFPVTWLVVVATAVIAEYTDVDLDVLPKLMDVPEAKLAAAERLS